MTLKNRTVLNFYDVFKSVTCVDGRLKISIRRDRPSVVKKSGIYIWSHPVFGYFYIGIAAKNNFTQRWNMHIQKLLDNCSSAQQMTNWKSFADRFAAAGLGIDDLKDIQFTIYPITDTTTQSNSIQFKRELEILESRLISILNPMCNGEYDPTRRSATVLLD